VNAAAIQPFASTGMRNGRKLPDTWSESILEQFWWEILLSKLSTERHFTVNLLALLSFWEGGGK
jgi:hypothetical protein